MIYAARIVAPLLLLPVTLACQLALAAAGDPPAPVSTAADAAYEQVASRYMNEMLALDPVGASQLGDQRFDAQLNDESAAGRARWVAVARSLLAQLDAVRIAQLSRAKQVDAHLLHHELEYGIWQTETFRDWSWDPLIYINLAGNSVYLLVARDFAPLPIRMSHVAARLRAWPRLFAQERAALDPAKVPAINAQTAVAQNAGLTDLIDQTIAPQVAKLPGGQQAALNHAIASARRAIAEQQTWLQKTLLPQAKGDFRIGAQRYDEKLRFELDSTLSRQQIRARAESAIALKRAQMYDIARQVLRGRAGTAALPQAPTPAQQQAGIEAALELAYADHPSRDNVMAAARAALAHTTAFVKAHDLITLYPDPLEVIIMPTFQQGVALAYCDAPGPLARGQKTYFAVSPIPHDWTDAQVRSYLREYNARAINELTIHEAMPGHYVQLAHADRYRSPIRAVMQSNAFVEGWAMYGEQLMSEQGYMDHDPLMQLVHLKWDLRATANAILDQAVHVDGMTREQAMHMLMHDTFQEQSEAAAKWVRVQLTSTQLATYFVGFQEHLALREEARQRWGSAFSLKRYHDTALAFGSPPVRYVRELMFDLPIG
ncbi:MAG TPA: DUF885 domain-containing protein [Steroidobacteraceae bacterium]|jgi:uncharacterized protein (DUF885 family)|nr:DUF885 domain-containing protein [Steroidobacteraceae bacterium]